MALDPLSSRRSPSGREQEIPADKALREGDARYLRGLVRAHRMHGGPLLQPTNIEVLERVLWAAGLYAGPVTITEALAAPGQETAPPEIVGHEAGCHRANIPGPCHSCGGAGWNLSRQETAPLPAPLIDVEAIRANLHATFNGGWQEPETIRAFRHGMDTVCNVLAARQKGTGTNGIFPVPPAALGHAQETAPLPDPPVVRDSGDAATIDNLTELIYWLLGERGEFPEEPEPLAGKWRRRFHWRVELRKRFDAIVAPPAALGHAGSPEVVGHEAGCQKAQVPGPCDSCGGSGWVLGHAGSDK